MSSYEVFLTKSHLNGGKGTSVFLYYAGTTVTRFLFFDKRNYYITIILLTTLVSAWMKIITNVVNALTGQRNREVAKTWSYRRMCNKPQEPKVESPPSTVSEHRALFFVYRHYIF